MVTSTVSLLAFAVTLLAIHGLEGPVTEPSAAPIGTTKPTFQQALSAVWQEPVARRFTVFVFVSMLAYSAQDLILEPFAGTVFGYSPGASTQLSGIQHGGVLLGMLLVAGAGALAARVETLRWLGSLRGWTIGGCIASAMALLGLVAAGVSGHGEALKTTVFALGAANGAFSIGAIGSMMRLANEGQDSREGVRMGLWGAAQAIAFGLGGLVGTGASDLARHLINAPGNAYAFVFALEALAFLASAFLAWRLSARTSTAAAPFIARAEHPALRAHNRLNT